MPQPGASPVFVATAHYAVNDLLASHPDPRLRRALGRERVVLYAASDDRDHELASRYGTGMGRRGGVLVAMHMGVPQQPQRQHEIMLFEDGVRYAALHNGVSLAQQIVDTTIHELEHHEGWAPRGHADATLVELEATLAAGGRLDPEQQRAYEQLRAQGQLAAAATAAPQYACPCWSRA